MKISALTDILIVEEKKGTKPQPDGSFRTWKVCHAIVYADNGKEPAALGVLRVPKALEPTIQRGRYTGEYGIGTSEYGDSKGEIQFRLTDLKPYAAPKA